MKVEINKRTIEVPQGVTVLDSLLRAEGLDGPGVAVAIDGTVVRRASWPEFELADGMKITILRAVCGG